VKKTTTAVGTGLALHWVLVRSDDGRTRMEMRWNGPVRVRRRETAGDQVA
jgi:hypothetical protein